MTFWFDTDNSSWTFDEDDRPQPLRRSWAPFAAAMIVCAGAGAAAMALRVLGV